MAPKEPEKKPTATAKPSPYAKPAASTARSASPTKKPAAPRAESPTKKPTAATAAPAAPAAKATTSSKPTPNASTAAAKTAYSAPTKPKASTASPKSPTKTAAKKAGQAGGPPASPSKQPAGSGGQDAGSKGAAGAEEPPVMSDEEQQRAMAEAQAKAQEEMEELRKKAWQAQVEYDQKQAAKKRKKAEEEARRRKEEAAVRKALLEAAFDGEDEQLVKLLAKGAEYIKDVVDCADAHGNTLLSEAAAAGATSTVKLLLERGANPNSQGEFKRTPLWRAAFLGKSEVVAPLLEGGADPRICNEQGELPVHVASLPDIKEALTDWDVTQTDSLMEQWQARQAERKAAAAAERAAALHSAEEEEEAARAEYERTQQSLKHARMELEKRIFEHDTCVEEKKPEELLKVTLEQIHAAEATVESARQRAAAAAERLDLARLALREQQQQQQEKEGGAGDEEEAPVGVPVDIKDLGDVLVRDVGGKVAAAGRWPLVIDPSGQSSVFLRYMDSNYVNALSSHNLEPNRLRRSILGGIRYGKPVVLDLMDCDLWPELPRVFDQVQPGLLASILDKSIMTEAKYSSLIRPQDGEEYDPNKFQDSRVAAFKFFLLTSSRTPNPDMVAQTYAIRVLVKG